MIVFVGDLHNAVEEPIVSAIARAGLRPAALVQVGDLEWWPDRAPPAYPWPTFFIDGNHDHLPSLLQFREPTEIAPNLNYCPRGSTLRIDGRTLGFLGGGWSIDRGRRVKGVTWFEEEVLRREEAEPLRGKHIDILVTHTPPLSIVQAMVPDRREPRREPEATSRLVEAIWKDLGQPMLVCGHMHSRFRADRVLVLGDMDFEPL